MNSSTDRILDFVGGDRAATADGDRCTFEATLHG
jgi:hypothetical protein